MVRQVSKPGAVAAGLHQFGDVAVVYVNVVLCIVLRFYGGEHLELAGAAFAPAGGEVEIALKDRPRQVAPGRLQRAS